jgi:hypothetical protein
MASGARRTRQSEIWTRGATAPPPTPAQRADGSVSGARIRGRRQHRIPVIVGIVSAARLPLPLAADAYLSPAACQSLSLSLPSQAAVRAMRRVAAAAGAMPLLVEGDEGGRRKTGGQSGVLGLLPHPARLLYQSPNPGARRAAPLY